MNQFPIDASVFDQNTVMVVGVEPVLDFDTEQQKTDRDGVLKWRLQVLYKAGRKPEVVEINFSAAELPEIGHDSRPVYKGLIGRSWENENTYGYSSGVSLSAEQIGFRSAPSASSGGREPAAAA